MMGFKPRAGILARAWRRMFSDIRDSAIHRSGRPRNIGADSARDTMQHSAAGRRLQATEISQAEI
jgi:hypothetical protein